ncbi:unnamed protein product [Haemonchus placei]|uniref:Low-density lipoprotein receptor domain class A n=1 Tax=Haemonchus placei TaxID=6290 RepID=A0A0N4X668_HAEPC|nr:unnamed protein product [Haemonchus placei]
MSVVPNPAFNAKKQLICGVSVIISVSAENNQQVVARWMCDGRIDCSDHSDEDDSVCLKRPQHGPLDGSSRYVPHTIKCPKGWFMCRDSSKCIASRFVCDQKNDCKDGSDEREFCHGWQALKRNCGFILDDVIHEQIQTNLCVPDIRIRISHDVVLDKSRGTYGSIHLQKITMTDYYSHLAKV